MLRLRGIVAGYGAGDVLRGLDLDVPRHSVTCLIGPNGAGKSTVFRVISGLLSPSRGSVRLGEREIAGKRPAEILELGVAQVAQARGIFAGMTVRENVLMGGYVLRRDRALVRRRFEELSEMFPLVAERAGEDAGNLSGGQQRMVEFARALMRDPELVLLDEPSAGLDPKSVKYVADSLRRMHDAGKTLLVVEQNVRFGLQLATEGVMLEAGKVAAHESAETLRRDPDVAGFLLGKAGRPRDGTSAR